MTDDELKALVASIAEGQKVTDAQLKQTDAQLKQTNAQIKQTDQQLAKTSAKVDKMMAMYGGMANNQGAAAEEFYYNTLKDKPVLQGMHFDVVYKNMTAKRNGVEDEYDILLVNGKAVYIIEVKYNAHLNDIQKIIDKKAVNFTILFPEYADYEHHLGLACFHIDDYTKEQALAAGLTILQRKGSIIETVPCQQMVA